MFVRIEADRQHKDVMVDCLCEGSIDGDEGAHTVDGALGK